MRRVFWLVLLWASFCRASFDVNEQVQVRIQKNLKTVVLSGNDLVIGEDPGSLRPSGFSRWRVSRVGARVWRIEELGTERSVHQLKTHELLIRGAFVQSEGAPVPPRIALRAGKPGSFHLIGRLHLRDYLIGVVAHEMPTQWPLHTLKAQAVAARSYTLKTRHERRGRGWDLESTIEDQVYRDVSKRNDLAKVRAAVIATDGIILTDAQRRPLKAYYHADCGGRTVTPASVWGGGADSGTAIDPHCPSSPRSRWTLAMEEHEFLQRLGRTGERLLGIETLSPRPPRHPAERFRLRTASGSFVMDANELRLKVGSTELKSTKFSVKTLDQQLIFEGKGFGHGAGLCQWGSRQLGQAGHDFTKILAHYYPKAKIETGRN